VSDHAFLDSTQEMIKQFYEKALPTQGVYCVTGIDPASGATRNKFTETFDEIFDLIGDFKKRKQNIFIAVSTFDEFSRKAKDAVFCRSLFIDLDIGEEKAKLKKGYVDADAALVALDAFIAESGLPEPVRVSSGRGVHAYWLLDEDVSVEEYLPIAQLFKEYCTPKVFCDPAVMADMARVMRYADSLNYKTDPPSPTGLISTELHTYPLSLFKEFLGSSEEVVPVKDILASIPKGLDEDTKAFKKLDNFKYNFRTIVIKSLEGDGCRQIAEVANNPQNPPYTSWTGALAVAIRCEDGEEAIQLISEGHRDYTPEKTITKAKSFDSIRTCEGFARDEPSLCEGCIHRGRITGPIELGREFIPAAAHTENTVWEKPDTKKLQELPGFLRPFVRGENGGIYYIPSPTYDKETKKKTQPDPVLFLAHDFWPIRRVYGKIDGECLLMRLELPNDPAREFLVPVAQSSEDLRKMVVFQGVPCEPKDSQRLHNYINKWYQYMINVYKADQIRTQLGWTEKPNRDDITPLKRAFVLGDKEINEDGKLVDSAVSPLIRVVAKSLVPAGTYTKWRWCMDQLERPDGQFDMQVFGLLCGFGSPLMEYTSTAGISVCFTGPSGSAKTGAMYAGLSIFGNPLDLSVFDATDNGMTGRYLALHNIMLGVDEVGDKKAESIALLVHKVSNGKAKIKMQGSVNAEREFELSASLINFMTANHPMYAKLVAWKKTPVGEAARLVEFEVKKIACLVGAGNLGREIFDSLKYNYGHAGTMYVQKLYEIGDGKVYEYVNKWLERFIIDFGDQPEQRFYQNLVSVTFAGGQIAKEAGIIDVNLERVYNKVLHEMINIRDNVAPKHTTDYPSILNEYINLNIPNILVLEGDTVKSAPRNELAARFDIEEGILQVSVTHFKKYLAELQVSSSNFEREMKQVYIGGDTKKPRLIGSVRSRLNKGWKGSGGGGNVWCYHFNPEEIDGLFSKNE